ncbi:hypothetical protein FisN_1Hh636 [Fistulifera solaris]|uniref:DUF6824 domain-containing protein n=1 Tax=Fistulifera solaris TaxID=1519565 RepID=A0A1Z5KQH8_FISSO|nr:hypothetical protein FisN_1Hh636 [Fistulifera solaris]|eukprot:GAX28574.1 hypothetical protein FisN_1Hh636 [Fistulifera solaris]
MSSFSSSTPEKYPLIDNSEASQENTNMLQQLLRSSDSTGLMAALEDDITVSKLLKSDESISDFMKSIGKSSEMFQQAFRSSDSAAMIAQILQSRSRARPDGGNDPKRIDAGSLMMAQFSDMLTSKEWLPQDAAKHIDNSSIQSMFFRSTSTSSGIAPKSTDWDQMFESQLPPSLTHVLPASTEAPSSTLESTTTDDDAKPAASSPKKKRRKRNRTKPNYDPEVMEFCEVTDDDVLLGRGGRSNHHAGNKRYLIEKEKIQPRYLAADKEAKTGISQELVDIVENWGGRFLKLDEETNQWYRVKNIVARKKASQTLREMNTEQYRANKRAKYGC